MLKVTVTNSNNQSLTITNSASYQLVSITGLNPPVANLSITGLATDDGSYYNMGRVPQRNIVLTIQPLNDIEANRTALYTYFIPKDEIRLAFKTGGREVYIDGIVEGVEIDFNSKTQLVQVSVICPDPFFKNKTETTVEIAHTQAGTTISNAGDVEQGVEITITALDAFDHINLKNLTLGEQMELDYVGAVAGDTVYINTKTGQKTATLTHNGTTTSIISKVYTSSQWPQMGRGSNTYTVMAPNSSAGKVELTYRSQFAGL